MTAAPSAIARSFLEALEDADLDGTLSHLDDDVGYTNVSLPEVRGRATVKKASRATA